MNDGQKKFFDFILERVQSGKEDDAKALLAESFGKQEDGTFGPDFVRDFIPRLLATIKQENIEEVKNIMLRFGGPPPKK